MRWRLQAKGYTTGQAWWRETAWAYGIGLLGFALYAAIAVVYRFLGVPIEIHWVVLHCLAWGFFVLAHLPDVVGSDSAEEFPGSTEVHGGFRCWNLILALMIAAINVTAAFLTPELLVLAEFRSPSVGPAVLDLALQGAVILFATLVHGLINAVACLGYRLAFVQAVAGSGSGTAAEVVAGTDAAGPAEIVVEIDPVPVDASGTAQPQRTSRPSAEAVVEPGSEAIRAVPSAPSAEPAASRETRSQPPREDAAKPSPAVEVPLERQAGEAAVPDTADQGGERPTTFRWFRRRQGREPIRQLLDYLGSVPSDEVRPTLRVLSAMAVGDPGRVGTPALMDAYKDHLFHPDGSVNVPALCRCLKAAEQAHTFYPCSQLGRTVYRPIARKLRKALRGVDVPAVKPWLAAQPPAVRRCAELILRAPAEQPVVVACVCSRNIHRSRTMQKALDHLIRRNSLGQVVLPRSGGVDLEANELWDLLDPALGRVLKKQNAVLARAGIREHDWPPQPFSDEQLALATVVLVADTEVERKIRHRLVALGCEPPGAPDKVLRFPALDPQRFRRAEDLPDPYRNQTSVRASARSILAVMADRVLPILLARAAALEPTQPWERRPLGGPPGAVDRTRVASYRAALVEMERGMRGPKYPGASERLLKLVWASANRDPAMLLLHGLPDALLEQARCCADLDDATLWNSLRNLSLLDTLIPKNRVEDYGKLARMLGKVGALLPASKVH